MHLFSVIWAIYTSMCPVPVTGAVSSPYGWRTDPITAERKFHAGLDIAAPDGAGVWLPFDSTVKRLVNAGSFGRHVILDTEHGTIVLAHLSGWSVRKGQTIPAWNLIGWVGQTGRATGPHLHIELRQGKRRRNPTDLFVCPTR